MKIGKFLYLKETIKWEEVYEEFEYNEEFEYDEIDDLADKIRSKVDDESECVVVKKIKWFDEQQDSWVDVFCEEGYENCEFDKEK
jgi:hypothetical protein